MLFKNPKSTEKWWQEHYEWSESCPVAIDATRNKDNKPKILKILKHDADSYLCSPELATDPSNNCVHIDEILPISGHDECEILVMPFLVLFNFPRFDTLGEIMDFCREVFVAAGLTVSASSSYCSSGLYRA
ncbi:hypothetical protein BDN70DRAFT_517706 [Pholiota conissans]|uniref:Uncharacterized protein n=1 Tax=Pholiota conissans TaxID=109636 RepID=A0A9P5Z686_9AGAR|nr:hypothetical protein BDN70DRAFT_517706 [Pholiota conissans]